MVQIPTNNTILTVAIFQEYTTNYYFKNTGNSYYSATTLSTLPSIIKNVEVNLNAMLNGRLYKRYPPGDVQFNGYKNLTPQMEAETLYECLTECVEYRLITQQYVNLNNSYSGTVNGSNAYQTQNNNVIGLRQDITAKLTMLGLYANALIGDVKPKAVVDNPWEDNGKLINYANLQLWYSTFSQHDWSFSAPITFQNNITFLGDVNAMDFNANNIVANTTNTTTLNATTINTTNLNFNGTVPSLDLNNLNLNNNLNLLGNLQGGSGTNITLTNGSYSTTYNGCNYTFPQDVLRLVNPWSVDLSDWSFFSEAVNSSLPFRQNYNQWRIEGVWNQPNGQLYLQSANTTYHQGYRVIKCHNQILNAIPSSYFTTATWYSENSDGVISIDLATMWNDAYNNSDWFSMTIYYSSLTQYDPSIPPPTQWTNYQVILDKIVGRINCIGGVDSEGNASRTSYLIDPIYTGYVGLTPSFTITDTSFAITGGIAYGGTASGTISPWWSDSNNQSLTQINLALDIYFSIVIITD